MSRPTPESLAVVVESRIDYYVHMYKPKIILKFWTSAVMGSSSQSQFTVVWYFARSVRKRFKPGDHVKVSKDLREAAEVGSITNVIGKYELHDLVQPSMFHNPLKSLSRSFMPDAQSPCSMTSVADDGHHTTFCNVNLRKVLTKFRRNGVL